MSDPVGGGWFVTGVGTGVGKTYISRGLTRALADSGRSVAAIKPLETGVAPDPLDARALARACGRPELATAPGLYRVAPPLAPHAAPSRVAAW
ncbi:MAG: dethiobiotin synthase, partial [Myxococcales bacterium]|nr:dethiobiotin synthase [Myxococcales bacterium]